MNQTGTSPHVLFQRLLLVIPSLATFRGGGKSESRGFMDLHLDVLRRTGARCELALAHYYKQNGDSVPDPDMQVLVDFNEKTAIATSYQDSICYREAEPRDTSPQAQRDRREMNSFLAQWLSNLAEQGHLIAGEGSPQ